VECFGDWVKSDAEGNFEPAARDDPESFVETLGVETVYPKQMESVGPAGTEQSPVAFSPNEP
jgi:hypothetical protein